MSAKNFVLMKIMFIKNSKLGISITDVLFFLLIVGGAYGAYLYIPIVYKTQELEALAKDYTFRTGGSKPDQIRAAVIEDAGKKLDVILNTDDVTVIRDENRVKIEITWNAKIQLPMGYHIPRKIHVSYDRKQL